MAVQTPGVEAGGLLGGVGVYVAADGVDLAGDLLSGAVKGAFKSHMLQKMSGAVFCGGLIPGAGADIYSNGSGTDRRDGLGQQSHAVGQGDHVVHGRASLCFGLCIVYHMCPSRSTIRWAGKRKL